MTQRTVGSWLQRWTCVGGTCTPAPVRKGLVELAAEVTKRISPRRYGEGQWRGSGGRSVNSYGEQVGVFEWVITAAVILGTFTY